MNDKVRWGVLGAANIAMEKVLPAMQLLTNSPNLTPMYAKRKLNELLGRVQNAAMDLDDIELVCQSQNMAPSVVPAK